MTKRVVIAGGGTGGHIMPGLALAEEFRSRDVEIMWIGAEGGLESDLVPKAGFNYQSNGMKRISSGPLRTFRKGIDAYLCASKVAKELSGFKADAVIGLGGYASVPSLIAAYRRSIPFFLLEQNVIPGKVTRWYAKKAKTVFSQFSEAREYLPKKTLFKHTGSPVRRSIIEAIRNSTDNRLQKDETMLVLGGSQGSRAINNVVCESLPELELDFPGLKIFHIAGKLDFENVKKSYENKVGHKLFEFCNDMGKIYTHTTFAVARAGAVSLAELSMVGIPVILIPYPYAADNHQAANARAYGREHAAVVIHQSKLTSTKFCEVVSQILHDPTERKSLCDNILKFARPDAARHICDHVLAEL